MQLDMLCFVLLRRMLVVCEARLELARLRGRHKSNKDAPVKHGEGRLFGI